MRKLKDILKDVPLQKRIQIIENTRRYYGLVGYKLHWIMNFEYDEKKSLGSILSGLFPFGNTKQGYDYWKIEQNKYK